MFWLVASLGIAAPIIAATNDLSGLLQKGLFEEEANHNFKAASEAYAAVVARFNEDRKLAATAVFRLGEICRKQGKTNEAQAQYERVVREFGDQPELVALSQPLLATPSTDIPISAPNNVFTDGQEIQKLQALLRDSPDLINAKSGPAGQTPLHQAVIAGQRGVVQFLIANRANLEAKNSQLGQTPLHSAAQAGHLAIVELLLRSGADVEATDNENQTPLHVAAMRGYKTIVERFLANKADVNAKSKQGSTPLHYAVAQGFRSVSEVLIAHGADLKISSGTINFYTVGNLNLSGTALHIAATRGDFFLSQLLLENKADPNLPNAAGQTPLHLAARNGFSKMVELLLARGAEIDVRDQNERTPLFTGGS